MTLIDLFLTPVFLIVILTIAFLLRPLVTNELTKSYFIPALSLKFLGAVSVGLIYYFYYGGGDTTNYYDNATHLRTAILDHPLMGLKMLLSSTITVDMDGGEYSRFMFFREDAASMVIVRITALLSLFCFNSYACISLLFALISFSGVWLLYQEVYVKEYPEKAYPLALAMLFAPSLFFWGSGILKDTITLGAMCYFIWSIYLMIVKSKFSFANILVVVISAYILATVKIYIILCLIPMMAIWYYLSYSERIASWKIKAIVSPIILLIILGGGAYAAFLISSSNERYSYDNIVETAAVTSWWIRKASGETGAAYRLSVHFDGSLQSIVRLVPEAFTVTFFRPFLWEVKNPVMLISALESLVYLVATVVVLVRKKVRSSLAISGIIFSIVFGVAVGISTSNFGALVRYKIPCLLIYGASLVLLYKKTSSENKSEEVSE